MHVIVFGIACIFVLHRKGNRLEVSQKSTRCVMFIGSTHIDDIREETLIVEETYNLVRFEKIRVSTFIPKA